MIRHILYYNGLFEFVSKYELIINNHREGKIAEGWNKDLFTTIKVSEQDFRQMVKAGCFRKDDKPEVTRDNIL